MLEGAGFEVVDLGVNTAPEKFVDAVRQHEPHIVGFSAFLTTTMPMFKVNIEALQKAGLRDKVTVMVGGAPVTEEYAKQSGADFYAADASLATRMAKTIVGASQSPESLPLRQAVELIDKTLRKG
jgi:5-methyltetrahydrofolate--homocysteine methyltransferase